LAGKEEIGNRVLMGKQFEITAWKTKDEIVGYIKNGSEEVVVEDMNWTRVRSNGRLWY